MTPSEQYLKDYEAGKVTPNTFKGFLDKYVELRNIEFKSIEDELTIAKGFLKVVLIADQNGYSADEETIQEIESFLTR